jgi:hypothetical protein
MSACHRYRALKTGANRWLRVEVPRDSLGAWLTACICLNLAIILGTGIYLLVK